MAFRNQAVTSRYQVQPWHRVCKSSPNIAFPCPALPSRFHVQAWHRVCKSSLNIAFPCPALPSRFHVQAWHRVCKSSPNIAFPCPALTSRLQVQSKHRVSMSSPAIAFPSSAPTLRCQVQPWHPFPSPALTSRFQVQVWRRVSKSRPDIAYRSSPLSSRFQVQPWHRVIKSSPDITFPMPPLTSCFRVHHWHRVSKSSPDIATLTLCDTSYYMVVWGGVGGRGGWVGKIVKYGGMSNDRSSDKKSHKVRFVKLYSNKSVHNCCPKFAEFRLSGILPKSAPIISKVVWSPFASTYETFQEVWNDFHQLPKSAIFKTMDFCFLLKIGLIPTLRNSPQIFTKNPESAWKFIW